MRTGGVPAALLLVLASALLQISAAGDIYWEGEEDAANEFLEVKDDDSALTRQLKRLKRDWFTPWFSTAKEDTDGKDDDVDNNDGSGSLEKFEPEAGEKTLRVTFVVMEPYRTPEYSNRDSPEFQNISRALANAVDLLFEEQKLPGTQKSSLVRIQSVVSDDFFSNVTLDIVTTGYDDTDRITEILKNHITQTGRLGALPVRSDSLKAQLIDPALSNNYDANSTPNNNDQYGNNANTDDQHSSNNINDNRGDQGGFDGYDDKQDGTGDDGFGNNNVESTSDNTDTSKFWDSGDDNNQPDDNQTDDNQPDDNQPDDNQTDDNQPDDNQTNDNQTDDNQPDDNQASGNENRYNSTSNTYGSIYPDPSNDNGAADNQPVDNGVGDNGGDSRTDYPERYPEADGRGDNGFDNNNTDQAIDKDDDNDIHDDNEVNYPTATEVATLRCNNPIPCAGSSKTICPEQRCDGNNDCPNNDDEQNCDERGDTNGQPDSPWWDGATTSTTLREDATVLPYRPWWDTATTTAPTSGDCSPEDMRCDVTRCLPSSKRCDGIPDCHDGADEHGCPQESCGSDDFRCNSGKCIERSKQCDGVINCPEREDETNCPCSRDEFQCVSDRSCIEEYKRCDGEQHCSDGSDEENCNACGPEQWQCDHGNCIKRSQRCDGRVDCPSDRSDERNCLGDWYFRCKSGKHIPQNLRCNRQYDCPSGDFSDEQNCPCGDGDFKCDNGHCIPASKRCDRTHDCQDRSDERHCTYGKVCMAFECTSGICVQAESRCNGTIECDDGSDEVDCPCRRGQYQCQDGSCINIAYLCNGREDCSAGEDEYNCHVVCPPEQITCNGGSVRCGKRCNEIRECDGGEDEDDCDADTQDCSVCSDGSCISAYKICDGHRDCSDGSDEVMCDNCDRPDDFRCRSGECLAISVRCNGLPDCADNSDELDCNTTMISSSEICSDSQFKCNSTNVCIQDRFYCDGNEDCLDGSDEVDCPWYLMRASRSPAPCRESEFTCYNGRCIPHSRRCDNIYDCYDFSDEQNCVIIGIEFYTKPTTVASCSDFQCDIGGCISTNLVCDGKRDCVDGSDESDCPAVGTSYDDTTAYNYLPPVYTTAPSYPAYDPYSNYPYSPGAGGQQQPDDRKYPGGTSSQRGQPGDRGYSGYPGESGAPGQPGDRGYPGYPGESGASGQGGQGQGSSGGYPGGRGPSSGQGGQGQGPSGGYPGGRGPSGGQGGQGQGPSGGYAGGRGSSGGQGGQGQGPPGGYAGGSGSSNGQGGQEQGPSGGYPGGRGPSGGQGGQGQGPSGGYVGGSGSSDGQGGQGQGPSGGYPGGRDPSGGQGGQGQGPSGGYAGGSGSPGGQGGGYRGNSGSGEQGVCSGNRWRCENGPCIDSFKRCDGHIDCPFDYSDEFDCPPDSPPALQLITYPEEEYVRSAIVGGDVVLICRDKGLLRAPVKWVREGGRPIKRGYTDVRGRLEMTKVSLADAGTYICQATDYLGQPGSELRVLLNVNNEEQVTYHPGFHCQADEATCGNGDCIPKIAVCDKKVDCADRSDEENCHQDGLCEPNQFKCDNGKCVLKNWICDSERDCGLEDDSDERNCEPKKPGEQCSSTEFACASGDLCIPKSYHCDGQNDCIDGSDEATCAPTYVSQPPTPANVVLNPGDTLILTCRAVGVPVPIVNWRRNWGHVPPQCISTSIDGVGTLTCTDMQYEHSGAYSCEAISVMGKIFATPDAIVFVNNTGLCPRGYFNNDARSENECIRCFCFGESTQCRSADLFTYNMPTPLGDGGTRLHGIKVLPSGEIQLDTQPITEQYYYEPLKNGATVTKLDLDKWSWSYSHPYLSLPETYNGNQLTSYGGYIKYTLTPQTRYQAIDTSAPTIIIKGKYRTLVYTSNAIGARNIVVEARLTPEGWMNSGPNGLQPAAREDIMMALDAVELILLRADYKSAGVNITDFVMESAQHINVGLGAASLVEECTCPKGYEGLSCQKCASGYVRKITGPWLGECVAEECPAGTYGNPSSGVPCKACPCPLTNPTNQFARTCSLKPNGDVRCDCMPGYGGDRCEYCAPGYVGNPSIPGDKCIRKPSDNCNAIGTKAVRSPDECVCKDSVQGRYCDVCKNNSFYLSSDFRHGCAQCFCSAVVQQCKSSNFRRKTIRAQFNVPQIVEQVKVYTSVPSSDNIAVRYMEPIETAIRPQLTRGDVDFQSVDRTGQAVYYWSLPDSFAGNKVTAYGGNFQYTLKNVDSRFTNNAADIQLISDNQLILQYHGNFQPSRDGILNVTIQLLEKGWQRPDGLEMPREYFLLALADVKTILIKASYSNNFQVASPVSASIEVASPDGTGPMAVHVEQCTCPPEYIGTSCEDCAPGYTRADEGIYLRLCTPCECSGKSNMCNPETGVCYGCTGNTEGDQCELCKPGYEKDANDECVSTREPVPCQCDPRGTSGPCDSAGNCYCKQNVEGENCDRCRPGTFGLDAANPSGCLSCFCSGVTTDCHEANHYTMTMLPAPMIFDNYGGYTITDLQGERIIKDEFVPQPGENELMYTFQYSPDTELYWSIPVLPGNRVLSYGGSISLKQKFVSNVYDVSEPGTDVILEGDNLSLYWTNPNQFNSEVQYNYQIPLRETGWYIQGTTTPASRSNFMNVLRSLRRVLVKATLVADLYSTSIADVSMDIATESYETDLQAAKGIEVCMCPAGYSGTSCESCKPNYYHDQRGYCQSCPCNGHGCKLDSYGQVVCICDPPYKGPDCSTIGGESTVLETTTRPPVPESTVIVTISEPKFLIREVGGSANFTCRVESLITRSPQPVVWTKSGGYLPLGRSYVDENSGLLVITQLQVYDSGKYICMSGDGLATEQAVATLQVPGNDMTLPVVEISPRVNEYYEGDLIELNCRVVEGNPTPNVRWHRGSNRPLPLSAQTYDNTIIINQASIEDSGEYICVGTNTIGTVDRTAVINVRPRPSRPSPEKLFVSNLAPRLQEGQSITLVCSGSANVPPESIDWSRLDNAIQSNVRNDNGVLYIMNAIPENQGIYICKSMSVDIAPVQVLISVIAVGPPSADSDIKINYDRLKVPSGGSASIDCNPSGRPLPSIKWRKHNDQFGPGVSQRENSLIITNAREEDRGYYVCEGLINRDVFKNLYVNVEIERRVKPVVNIWPKGEQAVTLGGEFELICTLKEADPEPVVMWSRSGDRPLSQYTHILPNNKLVFERIEVNDEGEYICTASNAAGKTSASATIKVRSAPEITITPNGYITVSLGDRINVECRGQGSPEPMVSISSQNDRRLLVPPSPGFAALRVSNAALQDDGDYVCIATSVAGTIQEQFTVAVDRGDGGDNGNNDVDIGGDDTDDPTYDPNNDPQYDTGSGDGTIDPGFGQIADPDTKNMIVFDDQTKIYIDCQATGRVEWKRSDGNPLQRNAVQQNSKLYIYNVSKSDSGSYVCNLLDANNRVILPVYTYLNVVTPPRIYLRPPMQTVQPGQSPTVECLADGDEIVRVFWRSVGKTPSSRVDLSTSILKFHQIEEEDTGTYECFAESRYANRSSRAEVIVREDTDRTSVTNQEHAYAGSSVQLSCKKTHPKDRVTWTKNGLKLSSSYHLKENGSLFIRMAQKSDTGRYMCYVKDAYGNLLTRNYINLLIEGSENPQKLATINKPPRPFRVGDNVHVTCITSSRDIRAYWERPGTNQYVSSHAYGDGAILEIQGVTYADAGVYRCVARDIRGRTTFEEFELVIEPGSETGYMPGSEGNVSQYAARLKSSVDLPCIHNLEPPFEFEWRHEFIQLPPEIRTNQPVLSLEAVTQHEAGTYICRVSNRRVAVEAKAILVVTDVVPRFQGESFISLPTLKDAFRQFEIEISFKPSDDNGLILYNSENKGRNGDYIALQLKDGVPELIINTGSGPLTVSGDRPLQLNTWHTIRLSRVDSKLNMDVDNTGTFMAESQALQWGVLDLNEPLYIGGVPDFDQLPRKLAGIGGYIGCVSMLLLRDKETNIMMDSLQQHRIASCNSCAPNLCFNNGICQEELNDRGYNCLCPPGYAGLNCDKRGEACRSGLCGPGKCTDTNNGYKCACPVSHTGKNCEVRQSIEYPAFSGSTFLAINPPDNARTLKMSMNIKAASPVTDGIIMYCAESARGYGGFTSLAVRNGKLVFRYDFGGDSTPVVLTSRKNLPANEWTTVHIARIGTLVSLKINQTRSVDNYEQKLDSPQQILNLNTPIFVGGVDETTVLNNNTGVSRGFSGCIKDFTLSGVAVDIMNDTIKSENVQECTIPRGDIPESDNRCRCLNGGSCTSDSTTCSCPYGYTGSLCERRIQTSRPQPPGDPCAVRPCRNSGICHTDVFSKSNYTCDCGLGFAGDNCQISLEIFQSVGFSGNGYLELPSSLLSYKHLQQDPAIIAMAIRTKEENGVLLYQKEIQSLYSNYGDYILIRIENGIVVVEWDMGGGKSSLSVSSVFVNDNNRHQIIAKLMEDGQVSLSVDEHYNSEPATGLLSTMNADSNIYLGGIPKDMNTLRYPGFTGCIEQLELMMSKRGINLGAVAVAGRNAQRCKEFIQNY